MTDEYFIDPILGSDTNSGTSPEKPWKTVAKAQSLLDSRRLDGLGTSLLFASGSVNYDLVPYYNIDEVDSFTGRKRFLVGAYGAGEKPIFSVYKLLTVAGSWQPVPAGGGVPSDVWVIDLSNPANYLGYAGSENYNIGHLRVDGKVKPYRRTSVAQLVNPWDFVSATSSLSSDRLLYVKSPGGAPNTVATTIEAAPPINNAIMRSGTTFRGIELQGAGQHNIRIRSTGKVTRETLIDQVTTQVTGGSRQAGSDGTPGTGSRLGNSVEGWIGLRDSIIRRSYFNDAYDCGFTCQGDLDRSIGWDIWMNCLFEYNTVRGASQGLEFWGRQDFGGIGGFINVRAHDNVFLNDGSSWSADVRNQAGRGVDILTYGLGPAFNIPTDIEVDHNVFVGAKDALRYHQDGTDYTSPPINDHDNTYIAQSDIPIAWNAVQTVKDRAAWQALTGHERESIFIPTPTSAEKSTASGKERTALAKGIIGAAIAQIALLSATVADPYAYTDRPADPSSSIYIAPRRNGNSASFTTYDTFKFEPWIIPFSGKLMGLSFDVTTAVSGAVVRGGILLRNAEIVSWKRIANPGAASAGSTGRKTISLASANQFVRAGDPIAAGVALQGTAGAALRAHTGLTNELVHASSIDPLVTANPNGFIVTGVNGDNIPTTITGMSADGNPMPVLELLIAPA